MRTCLSFLFLLPGVLGAQSFQAVFPGLSGSELLDSVASNYRPAVVLDWTQARDTLFARVLGIDDDSLRCIYSGHTLYLDPTQDPTQYVYLNGTSLGMNTEHAYPQSKGASDGNARSDMHHLFPSRIAVNEARADFPFADIPDPLTQKWFYRAQTLSGIPSQDIDLYAESRTGSFEPRESVKGDIARAVFYFYTVYKAQAFAADPDFFDVQRATLCAWNEADLADSAELVKTWRIAAYQDDKPNPFVLDCTLAYRAYCPETPPGCTTGTDEPVSTGLTVRLLPNPAVTPAVLELGLASEGAVELLFWSAQGQLLGRLETGLLPAGTTWIPVAVPEGRGVLYLEARLQGAGGGARNWTPIVRLP